MTCAKNRNEEERPLTSVMEDYLEAIFDLDKDKKVVRVKDIAGKLHVRMPTVSSMLKTLRNRGLVNYAKYEYVELTDEGAGIGREMRRRHEALRKFLNEILKIDFPTADEEACKMEHALSTATLDSLTEFMEFIQSSDWVEEGWRSHLQNFRLQKEKPGKRVEDRGSLPSKVKSGHQTPKARE